MNRSALVTGCSSGLGKEVALGFAARGYRVFAGVRKAADAEPLMTNGNSVTPVILDLRNGNQIAETARFVDKQCGADGLSIIVNMAGYTFVSPFEFTEEKSARELFDVLLFGPAALTEAAIAGPEAEFRNARSEAEGNEHYFLGRNRRQPFRRILLKRQGGLLATFEAQFYEFQSIGVDAIAIIPGLMKTPFVMVKVGSEIETTLARLPKEGQSDYASSLSHMAKMGRSAQTSSMVPKPNLVAKRILKIAEIKSPRSRYLIGTDTRLVNLFNKLLPLCLLEAMKKKLFRISRNVTSVVEAISNEKRLPDVCPQ